MTQPDAKPRCPDRRGGCLHDPANDDGSAEHIEIVIVPLAGGAAGGGALEDQIALVLFTEPTCAPSFDHLVGAGEQHGRYVEAERPRSFEIYDRIELGR